MFDYNESDVKYWWTLSNERISCATGITIEKGNLINKKPQNNKKSQTMKKFKTRQENSKHFTQIEEQEIENLNWDA